MPEWLSNILPSSTIFTFTQILIFCAIGLTAGIIVFVALYVVLGRKMAPDLPASKTSTKDKVEQQHQKILQDRLIEQVTIEPEVTTTLDLMASKLIPLSEKQADAQADKLHKAGIEMTPHTYYMKLIFTSVVVACTAVFAFSLKFPIGQSIPFGICIGGVAGILMNSAMVTSKIQNRAAKIERQMPNTLQLLAVITTAGAGIQQAFQYIGEHQDNELGHEFYICNQEMNYGSSTNQALRNLMFRNDVESLNMFCGTLIQSSTQGMSVSDIMKQQSETMQERMRLKTEEQANKIPTKLLFPTILMIFPTLFIAMLAPAFSSLLAAFS